MFPDATPSRSPKHRRVRTGRPGLARLTRLILSRVSMLETRTRPTRRRSISRLSRRTERVGRPSLHRKRPPPPDAEGREPRFGRRRLATAMRPQSSRKATTERLQGVSKGRPARLSRRARGPLPKVRPGRPQSSFSIRKSNPLCRVSNRKTSSRHLLTMRKRLVFASIRASWRRMRLRCAWQPRQHGGMYAPPCLSDGAPPPPASVLDSPCQTHHLVC